MVFKCTQQTAKVFLTNVTFVKAPMLRVKPRVHYQ